MELQIGQALKKLLMRIRLDGYMTLIAYIRQFKVEPRHPDANHNMGVLAVGIGKLHEALPFFNRFGSLSNVIQFWLSYIDALIKLDRAGCAFLIKPPASWETAKH